MQSKKENLSRRKQKRSDANIKDRMQTKMIGCKQKRSDANKKDRMQTRKKDANKKGSANYKENGIMLKGQEP